MASNLRNEKTRFGVAVRHMNSGNDMYMEVVGTKNKKTSDLEGKISILIGKEKNEDNRI